LTIDLKMVESFRRNSFANFWLETISTFFFTAGYFELDFEAQKEPTPVTPLIINSYGRDQFNYLMNRTLQFSPTETRQLYARVCRCQISSWKNPPEAKTKNLFFYRNIF
jgi:hypothetical protein